MQPDSTFPAPSPTSFTNPTIPSPDQTVVVTAKSPTPKKKIALASLVILTLIAGVITAVFLVQRQARLKSLAWNCSAYNFNVSQSGVVTVTNQSQYSEPAQEVGISINGSPAGIFDVPALPQGQSSTLGTVTVPESGAFTWEAVGTIDCRDTGTYLALPTPIPTDTIIPSPTEEVTTTPTETISPTVSPTTEPTISPTIEPTVTISLTPPIGGPDPSPTPTSVPGPTSTPGPTGIPDPTATPITNRPNPSPTPTTQLPATGNTDLTWLLTTSGLILLGLGALLLVF
jgi:uncharacterized surface anchored protein